MAQIFKFGKDKKAATDVPVEKVGTNEERGREALQQSPARTQPKSTAGTEMPDGGRGAETPYGARTPSKSTAATEMPHGAHGAETPYGARTSPKSTAATEMPYGAHGAEKPYGARTSPKSTAATEMPYGARGTEVPHGPRTSPKSKAATETPYGARGAEVPYGARTPAKSTAAAEMPYGATTNRSNGNCFMLYARDLSVTWSEKSEYWKRLSLKEAPNDPPVDILQLLNVCWLDVSGKFNTRNLTPGTRYEVVFVVKLEDPAFGWEKPVNLKLIMPNGEKEERQVSMKMQMRYQWLEIKAGEFVAPENAGDIKFSMYEHESGEWKKGLFVKGVAIRAKIH